MTSLTASRQAESARWSFLQWAVLIIGIVHLVWAVVGWVAEPSFAMGMGAPSKPVLGMDYNGWHGLAGLLLFAPTLVVALRKNWAAWYCVIAGAGGGFVVGLWALFAHSVLMFSFPNHVSDAIEHLVTGVVLFALVGIQALRDGGLRAVFKPAR